MLKHVDVKCLQSELCICVCVKFVCTGVCVCFPLDRESGEAHWGGRGKNKFPQHTERAPIPLSSTLTVGLCSSQLPMPLHLTGPPLQAWSSAGLQRWAGGETRDPTFACSTEWQCFHLDLYHSYSSASPMNICLIHCFFFSLSSLRKVHLLWFSKAFISQERLLPAGQQELWFLWTVTHSGFLFPFLLFPSSEMNSFPLFSYVPANRSQKVTIRHRQKRFMMFTCAFKDKELESLKEGL